MDKKYYFNFYFDFLPITFEVPEEVFYNFLSSYQSSCSIPLVSEIYVSCGSKFHNYLVNGVVVCFWEEKCEV